MVEEPIVGQNEKAPQADTGVLEAVAEKEALIGHQKRDITDEANAPQLAIKNEGKEGAVDVPESGAHLGVRAVEIRQMERKAKERPQIVFDQMDPKLIEIRKKVKDREELLRKRASQLKINTVNNINIAIIGLAGTGKSSLLNALQGEMVAKDDFVEATQFMKSYDTDKDYIKIWDVPGAATVNHGVKRYFDDNMLYMFDYLLIVITNRLYEFDLEFAKAMLDVGGKFAFVRSKSDIDIDNYLKSTFKTRTHKATPDQIKKATDALKRQVNDYLKEQCTKARLGTMKFYYVSSMALMELNKGQKDPEYPLIDEENLMNDLQHHIQKTRYNVILNY